MKILIFSDPNQVLINQQEKLAEYERQIQDLEIKLQESEAEKPKDNFPHNLVQVNHEENDETKTEVPQKGNNEPSTETKLVDPRLKFIKLQDELSSTVEAP